MGNNNATPSSTEEQSSKLENNGNSPLESGSVETTQDQMLLASQGKDGDRNIEKENLPDGEGTSETEPQRSELVTKAKNVDEEMHESGLKSLVMETDEQLQKHMSVTEGVETASKATEVEELSMVETQSVESKLKTTEIGNEEKKPSAIEETVVPKEEKMVNESLEETVPVNEVVKLDQETSLEQRTNLPEAEPQEILNLDDRLVVDKDVKIEVKADEVISKPRSIEESKTIQETDLGVYKEKKTVETGRGEVSLEPASQTGKVTEDSQVQQLVPEAPCPASNKKDLEKPKTSETMHVPCLESNKAQEATEALTETNKEARIETQSPRFENDLRSHESTEKTPLLHKTETYEATIGVEEKTVMLKRSESARTKANELAVKPTEKSEGDDSLKENKGSRSRDNLLDKKDSMKGKVRKRSKSSSFLGTCLGCGN